MSIFSQNLDIYAHEAKVYAKVKYWGADEQSMVEKFFKKNKILVLGCGAGRTLKPLHELGFDITAIDIVPEMITESRKKMKDLPVEVIEMDAAKLAFPNNSFDTVFFPFHGIDYVEPNIYAAVSEAARVLKTDGVFIFSSHNRLYLKKIHRFFVGIFDNYHGLKTYRTSPRDVFKLKRYFKKVKVVHKIDLASYENLNWKDRLYKIAPWFSKTTYFVCMEPKHD
jgi:ubiquinone/menaquinone biosynthesis C-methylase UbiE